MALGQASGCRPSAVFAIIQLSPSILAPPSAFVPQLCALCVLCGYFFRIGFLPTRSVTSVILAKNSRCHLTFPNPCYITRLEVYMVNSPSRPNVRPVDPPPLGASVRHPFLLPPPAPRPARGEDVTVPTILDAGAGSHLPNGGRPPGPKVKGRKRHCASGPCHFNKEQTPLGGLFDPNPRFHGGCFGVRYFVGVQHRAGHGGQCCSDLSLRRSPFSGYS